MEIQTMTTDLAHGCDEDGAVPEGGVLPVQQQRHRAAHGLAVQESALAPVLLKLCMPAAGTGSEISEGDQATEIVHPDGKSKLH